MIQSMTGYGKAVAKVSSKQITIEIKALNSRQLDLCMHIPPAYKEKEMQLRNLLSSALKRGTISLFIQVEYLGQKFPTQINRAALESYHRQISEIANHLRIAPPSDWFQTLLHLPEAVRTEAGETDEREWKAVQKALRAAIDQVCDFRKQEGKMMEAMFADKINHISALLTEAEQYEGERIETIKSHLMEHLEALPADYDKTRFEQEMIYYLEKFDVNEEKSRLRSHLSYFLRTMEKEEGQGKKLGFILQEIGREIGTLGAKCHHLAMQQLTVQMKDALEQIREQQANVL